MTRKTSERENSLLRCHSLENARKAPLIIDFIAEVKQDVLAGNDVSSDNPTIELLDRCKTLEEAKEDPLVLELIDKLKNEVSAKAGKTIYWEDVLEGNPKIPTLLGYALLSEIGVPENYDLRREILDEHRDVPVLLFYSLLSQIVNSPGCEVLCGKFESKKKASKASARNIYRKPALDKKRK
ncbi:MAG: hypothetical protein JW999_07410 [Methanotrichaceae archaeon]|nr:hypothetical protein [Methanotrichaceae archaeon]